MNESKQKNASYFKLLQKNCIDCSILDKLINMNVFLTTKCTLYGFLRITIYGIPKILELPVW